MVWDILSWLFFIVFIAGLIIVGGLLLKGYLAQEGGAASFTGSFFGPKPEKRLDVVDQANVDGRRRLVLVRRDDVEHLIMTGGPVDVVIETNIENKATPAFDAKGSGRLERDKVEPIDKKAPTLVSRPSRTLSKTADEA
ncbi:MAG: flagellar protein FliO/FliZ [Hyphomicrobiaceae bacterium]|jgi:flagellar protein FliO/FliZ